MTEITTPIKIQIESTDSESDTMELARFLEQSDFRFEISNESLSQLRSVAAPVIAVALSTPAVLSLARVLLIWLKRRRDKPKVTITTPSEKFVLGVGNDDIRLVDSLRQMVEAKHDSLRPPKDWD